jgi:hypothetical protein
MDHDELRQLLERLEDNLTRFTVPERYRIQLARSAWDAHEPLDKDDLAELQELDER